MNFYVSFLLHLLSFYHMLCVRPLRLVHLALHLSQQVVIHLSVVACAIEDELDEELLCAAIALAIVNVLAEGFASEELLCAAIALAIVDVLAEEFAIVELELELSLD